MLVADPPAQSPPGIEHGMPVISLRWGWPNVVVVLTFPQRRYCRRRGRRADRAFVGLLDCSTILRTSTGGHRWNPDPET
jgi:hypothetical protein